MLLADRFSSCLLVNVILPQRELRGKLFVIRRRAEGAGFEILPVSEAVELRRFKENRGECIALPVAFYLLHSHRNVGELFRWPCTLTLF